MPQRLAPAGQMLMPLILACLWLLAPPPLQAGEEPRRWSLELGGTYVLHRDLYEHFMFNPAAAAVSQPAGGWERKWSEERAWVSLSYELLAGEHWRLSPGLRLGQSWARFSASNNGLNFSEQWRAQPALLWGGFVEAELRRSPREGPFLRLRYSHLRAEADERSEATSANRSGQSGDHRQASFRWQEEELLLALGWRLGPLRPWLGASRLDWRLKKWLDYRIPEDSARSPADLALIRALNDQDSEYHYHNENTWAPAAGLEWDIGPGWSLSLQGRFLGHEEVSLALAWEF